MHRSFTIAHDLWLVLTQAGPLRDARPQQPEGRSLEDAITLSTRLCRIVTTHRPAPFTALLDPTRPSVMDDPPTPLAVRPGALSCARRSRPLGEGTSCDVTNLRR